MNKIPLFNIPSHLLGALFFALILITACSVEDPAEYLEDQKLDCRSLDIGPGEDHWEDSVPYGIDSIWLQGTCISFDVAFTGGCEEHDFSLWWNETISEHVFVNGSYNPDVTGGNIIAPDSIQNYTNINKVPVLALYLIHNSKADNCEAFVRSSHSFNIGNLQQSGYPEVLLEIHSTDEIFSYKYRWK